MTHILLSKILVICTVLIFGAGPFAIARRQQSADAPIKVRATLVSVPVIVSDRQDRYIAGLKSGDFKLFEDGVEQQISFFDSAEEPLNVALMLDTSHSTLPVLDDIKKAAKDFIKELRPQDRATVLSFDYDVHRLAGLTSDRKKLERAIKEAEIGEEFGTVLRDAVADVAGRQFKTIDGRKAIVVLTDGKDYGSKISESELFDLAAESGAMIYALYYETGPGMANSRRDGPLRRGPWGRRGRRFSFSIPPQQRRGPGANRRERVERTNAEARRFLTILTDVSAGRFYSIEGTDLKKTFKLVAEELRHQYQLGFYPDNSKLDGKVHMLRVQVLRPDVAVRARRGYSFVSASTRN